MKRVTAFLITALTAVVLLTACGSKENININNTDNIDNKDNKGLKIVTTVFPEYDWVRQILGEQAENAELTLLLDNGVDLHSYQPTADDIIKISNCDMFVYVGGESDSWVKDALKTAVNKNMVVINLVDVLGDEVKEEEIKEGMEHDHEHGHEEFDTDDVRDRNLSDWDGSWATIENALSDGSMDEYVRHNAEENGMDFEAQKDEYFKRWKSDYKALNIDGDIVSFGDVSAKYDYAGYKIVESDQGVSVWYGFKTEAAKDGIPVYIAFSDHDIGAEEEHEDEDEHEHEEAAHFHLRYGNESFEALTEIEGWSPTYFSSDMSGEEVAEAMGGHGHSQEGELDEHVWLSLKNAKKLCGHIADKLSELDEKNSSIYKQNAEEYGNKLDALDGKYKEAVSNSTYKTLLFGDRFPFRYLTDDYGLDYYAAFSGCSAETEASFETIVFLANKVNELNLKNIMVIETSDQSIARTVAENTKAKNQRILVLDSLQSIVSSDISSGKTYLSVMEDNLEALKEALN